MSGHDHGEFDGAAGRINWRAWLPDSPAVAVVLIVHGVAEHSGRYAYLGEKLASAGFACYALDHHGHGRSAGGHANIGRMSAVADDISQMLSLACQLTPGRPRFLIGHSMGALATLYLTTRTPMDLAGVVLSGTPLQLPPVHPALRRVAPLLSRIAPNTGTRKLDSLAISRDMAVVRSYDTDPLNHRGKLPVRTGLEIMDAVDTVTARLATFTYPLLVLHGSSDAIAHPGGADIVARGVSSPDVTVTIYDHLYHEIFNEPERDEVIADVRTWLTAHLPATPPS
ncbi:MAG: alpha/beta hydrolase [Mycobacteriaceae bacterium]|nr:alpha/beta hydrolase [Mycobacteriaceae bacterium]